MELIFEWDENKNRINQKKHGISFEEAEEVFYDPDHSLDEERFLIIGISATSQVLTVSHCYRRVDEIIRIISARRATKKETAVYYDMRSE